MSRRKPLPPGEHAAEIADLVHDGRGLARVGGKATFIADALPGEAVKFRYLRVSKDADEGQATAIERASADRATPACTHFGLCGGCSMQHLEPSRQIAFKQKQLLDQLARIGKVFPAEVAEPVTGPTWGYRRRARLGVRRVPKKGGVLVGFRERESNFLAQLDACHTLDARVGLELRELGSLIGKLSINAQVPQIEVACAGHVAGVFRVLQAPTDADRDLLQAWAAQHDWDIYLQTGGPDSIRPLGTARPLEYSPDGSPLSLRFEPTDFVQVNEVVSQRAVRQALDWLAPAPGERVLELFCGLGNFSLPLAARGASVTAVEGEAGLVQRARENATRNGLDIRFERADLFTSGADASWMREPFDSVLLDPPRAGAQEILPLVAARRPRRIVYVSCHPGTLARDAGTLVHQFGYALRKAGVMDMFPHTSHVESMALFTL